MRRAPLTSVLFVVAALTAIVAIGCGSSGSKSSASSSPPPPPPPADKASGPRVGVFPAAGTPTANAKTQISFRGVAPDKLTGIKVTGSKSGTHSGTLKSHSDDNGASFIPSQPFTAGETVSVRASSALSLIGARNGVVTFKIAEHAPIGVPGTVRADPGGTPDGSQTFHTRPDLHPNTLQITKKTGKAAPGYIFSAPKAGPGQDGPMITDGDGKVVWFRQVPKLTSPFDFRVQQYAGKPALTYWQGGVHHGQGRGEGLILNQAYKTVARVKAGNGYKADFHEFEISRESTAYLIIYQPVLWDLRAIGGPKDGSVLDGIVQEIDIPTGLVLYEWHSLGNINIKESYSGVPKSSPMDVTHVNSVQEEKDGNLLVSSRDTHSALELDHKSGRVLWRLGGKKSDYKMGKGTQFIGQHHIRRISGNRLTVFDNGAPPSPGRAARALVLKVDDAQKKVSLQHAFQRPTAIHSPSQGSVQALPNGNFLVGWGGDTPYFDEYTSSGQVALDGNIKPTSLDTYRIFKMDWVGKPDTKPDVVGVHNGGKTTVYVSWNGATEVAKWEVLAGDNPDSLSAVKTANRDGFETAIQIPGSPAYVKVRALDSSNNELGVSEVAAPQAQ